MRYKTTSLIITFLITFTFMFGCSTSSEQKSVKSKDDIYLIREIAWDYLKERNWDNRANVKWKTAKVTQIIADDKYHLLNKAYEGRKVFSVSFEDKKNIAIGTPVILVDPDSNEIVGYLPGE